MSLEPLVGEVRWYAALGVRFVLRGTDRATSSLLMMVGVAGVTVLALSTLGAPHVAADRAERTEAIAPQVNVDRSADDPRRLRMILPFDGRRWNGHAVGRHYYARGSSSLAAPGVSRMPAPGEYVASPALVDLIERDGTVAALFGGMRRTGVIGSDGLVQPHELRAVVGISGHPRTPGLVEVDRFGGTPPWVVEDRANLNQLVAFFVLALIWLPVGAFILVISRLSSRQRSRRARSLRLVGASRRSVLLLHGLEAAVICAPGALVGAVVYDRLVTRMTSVPGTEIGFFGQPARAGWLVSALIAGLVVSAFAVPAAAAIQRSIDTNETAVPSTPSSHSRRSWGLRALIAGVGLLVAAPLLLDLAGGVGFSSLWVGCALVAVGVGATGSSLVGQMMRWAGGKAPLASALVGLRMGAVESSSIRLASLFSVIVILLLGGLAFMNVLNGGSADRWDERLAEQPRVPVIVTDLIGGLSLQEVRDIAPDASPVETRSIRHDKQDIPIVYGSCADLEQLTGVAARDCSNRPQWIRPEGSSLPKPTGQIQLPGGASVKLPEEATAEVQMSSRAMPPGFGGALLVPPSLAPTAPTYEGSSYLLLVTNTDLKSVMAKLSAGSPQLQFDLARLDYHNPDTLRFPTQVRWLTVGTIVSLLLGVAAISAAGIGEAGERTARMRGLRILGARRSFIFSAHLWSTITPIVALGWIALVAGWLVCAAMENVDDRAAMEASTFGWTALGVLAAALVVGMLTYPAVTRRSARSAGVEA